MDKTGGRRLKQTLKHKPVACYEMIDTFNKQISTDGISFTITTGVSFRNYLYVIVEGKNASKKIR